MEKITSDLMLRHLMTNDTSVYVDIWKKVCGIILPQGNIADSKLCMLNSYKSCLLYTSRCV